MWENEGLYSFFFGGLHRCCLCDEEKVLSADGLCSKCQERIRQGVPPPPPPPLDGLAAGLAYDEYVSAAIYRFKAQEQKYLGGFLTQYMRIPSEWSGEVLVPVPLSAFRQFLRGFNQSHELALRLSATYGIPVDASLLKKSLYTADQKELGGNQRTDNLRYAFVAAPEAAGHRIILVDDVITTGATLSACAKALKNAGAAQVYAITAACVMR